MRPEAQAAAGARVRPAHPQARATLAATVWLMTLKKTVLRMLSTLCSRKNISKNSCSMVGLPTVEPTATPMRCSGRVPRPAFVRASHAARQAKMDMGDMERRNSRGMRFSCKGGTSPATRHDKPSSLYSGKGDNAQRFSRTPSYMAGTPSPNGETAPMPVTTTRLPRIP